MSCSQRPSVASLQQNNSGTHCQIAGRDFNEIHLHGSFRAMVRAMPDEVRDSFSERSEEVFLVCYGFSANAVARTKVLALRRQWDLTLRQVRHLKMAGLLSVRHAKVELQPFWPTPALGWLYALLFTASGAAFALGAQLSSGAWQPRLAGLLLSAFCLANAWAAARWLIAPSMLLKRLGSLRLDGADG